MLPQKMIKVFFLISLLFVNSAISGGADDLRGEIEELTTPFQKVMSINAMKVRKLMMTNGDVMLDYRDPVANPIHDPGKGH